MDIVDFLNHLARERRIRALQALIGEVQVYACDDADILAPAIEVLP